MALLTPFKYTVTQPWGPTKRTDEPAMWAYLGRAWYTLNAQSVPRTAFKFYAHFHPAIDCAAPEGTPIQAPEAGIVSASGLSGVSGLRLRVQVNPRFQYGFGHCSKLLVPAGYKAARGEIIALVGHTGGATGPHAHFFTQIGSMLYDPRLFFPGGANANDPRIKPLA